MNISVPEREATRRRQLRIALLALLLLLTILILNVRNPPDRDPASPSTRSSDALPMAVTGPLQAPHTSGVPKKPAEGQEPETGEGKGADHGDETDPLEGFSLTEPGPTSVAVQVRDHEGEAVSATVEIRIVRPPFRFLGTIETDDAGIARGYLPGPGSFLVEADVEGTRREAMFEVTRGGQSVEIEIRIPGTAVLSGRVVGESGPLGEDRHGEVRLVGEVPLLVEAFAGDGGRPLFSPVDEFGHYRISGLAAGSHVIAVRSKFHAETVEIEDGANLVHDIRLPEGMLSGRVLEEWSGQPGSKVQVVVQLARAPSDVQRTFAALGIPRLHDRLSPDAAGLYAFTNLPDGEYVLFANGIGYGVSRASASIGPGNRSVRLDFALKRGAEIFLTIRDAAGRDLPGPVCMTAGLRFGFTGKVVGFAAGKQDFVAWAPGHAVGLLKAVALVPGEPVPVAFVLPRAAITKLRFVDPDGRPLVGVRVSVPREGHDLQAILAQARRGEGIPFQESAVDGVAVVAGAVSGPCRITAKKSGFALFDGEIELPEGGGSVDVELTPADTSFRTRVRISGLSAGGQAEALGLRVGDVLVMYARAEISAVRDLQRAMEAASGTGKITLAVERSGKRIEVEVAPGVLGVTLEELEE